MKKHLAFACALAAILASACAGPAPTTGPTVPPPTSAPSPSPTATVTSSPTPALTLAPGATQLPASGPLPAGTYLYDRSQFTTVPFQFTVPDGWVVQNDGWNINADQPDELGFASSILDSINADACAEGTELVDAGSTVDELVNALLDESGPVIEGPFDVTLGGYAGQRLDVTSPPAADLEGCNVPGGLQLWRDQAGNYFVVFPDWQTSIYILDVGGDRLVLMTVRQESSPAADVAELEAVIESIEFEP